MQKGGLNFLLFGRELRLGRVGQEASVAWRGWRNPVVKSLLVLGGSSCMRDRAWS